MPTKLIEIQILEGMAATALINPYYVQYVYFVSKHNSMNPLLLEKEYSVIVMSDTQQYCVEQPLSEIFRILNKDIKCRKE